MKTKLLLSLIAILFISATSFGQGFTKPAEGKSVIYIVNIMLGFGQTKIYDGTTFIDILKSRDYIRYECEAGEHTFLALRGIKKDFLTTDFEADKIYIIRMRTIEKMGGDAPYFRYFDKSQINRTKTVLKLINKDIPNKSETKFIEKIQTKWFKQAKKSIAKFESKLKAKNKHLHISKDMFYQK